MKKLSPVVDTNIILRFLVGDDLVKMRSSKALFESSPKKSLEIPLLVIAEVVYVLGSFYKFKKTEIVSKILELMSYPSFRLIDNLTQEALSIYRDHTISFVDAYLVSRVQMGKNSQIVTFDKGIQKVDDHLVFSPQPPIRI